MALDKDTLPRAIGDALEQNNYSVEYSLKFSGSEVDIVASPIGSPFSPKLYIEATIQYVNNTKYGKDLTKFSSLRETDPGGVFIIVSMKGFTPDVKERARTARIRTYTYEEFLREFEKFDPYLRYVLDNDHLKQNSKDYEESNFSDRHGAEVASKWFMDWATAESISNKWIILLGEYGTGKTCLTEVLQYRLVRNYVENPKGPVPIRINLREFTRQFDAGTLLHHFLDTNRLGHMPIDFVFALIRSHRIVLLLDGYDEMAQFMNARERRACLKTLADLAAEGARGILTSRPNYFTEDEELRVFEALYGSLDQRTLYMSASEKRIIDEERAIDTLIEEHILNRFERILQDLTPEQTTNLINRKLGDDEVGRKVIIGILNRTLKQSKSFRARTESC